MLENSKKYEVTIYTDGACRGNPGPGGWGAVLLYKEHRLEISGEERKTTNNRMELMAAIKALKTLKKRSNVTVFTDSKYVRNGITNWIHNWKRNNWKRKGKAPVKNADLWQELDRLNERHSVRWNWVKGHSGDELNDRADELARDAIEVDGAN